MKTMRIWISRDLDVSVGKSNRDKHVIFVEYWDKMESYYNVKSYMDGYN